MIEISCDYFGQTMGRFKMYSGGRHMVIIFIWLILSMIVGAVASGRGHSGILFFLLSLVLSPLIGLLAALIVTPSASPASPVYAPPPSTFDINKWNALVEFDEDIKRAVATVQPYGGVWVNELAKAVLSIDDKAYLDGIVAKIVAKADAAPPDIRQLSEIPPDGFGHHSDYKGVKIHSNNEFFWVEGQTTALLENAKAIAGGIALRRKDG